MDNNCKHIYQEMKEAICIYCNKPTHATDWSLIAKLHKNWVQENPDFKYTWWSI